MCPHCTKNSTKLHKMKLPNNNHLFTWMTDLYFQSDHCKCFGQILTNSTQNDGQPYPWVWRTFVYVHWLLLWLLDLSSLASVLSLKVSLSQLQDLYTSGWLTWKLFWVWNNFDRNRFLTCSFIPQGCPCLLTNLKKNPQTQKQTMTTKLKPETPCF